MNGEVPLTEVPNSSTILSTSFQFPRSKSSRALFSGTPILASELLFVNYEAFLALLDNPEKRAILVSLDPSQVRDDKIFQEVREISHRFRRG